MSTFQEVTYPQESTHNMPDIRIPAATDGVAVHNLIRNSAFLDDNSLYCYLLVCSHFARTSAIAHFQDDVVGVISGYIIPERPDTLFIWQVAVDVRMRRRGLARAMLDHILQGDACSQQVRYIETTVTADNAASRRLFSSLAEHLDCRIDERPGFDRREHFLNLHDSEPLLRIGPFFPNQGERT